MPNVVGALPQFTEDGGGPEQPQEEVKETKQTETASEPPADIQPAATEEKPSGDGTGQEVAPPVQNEQEKAIQALQQERAQLLKDIVELRGQRREIKQEQIAKV